MSYNNILTNKIYDLLVPMFGEVMSKSILKVQCAKINIPEEAIGVSHLDMLAEKIEIGIKVFLGAERSREVSRLIKELAV